MIYRDPIFGVFDKVLGTPYPQFRIDKNETEYKLNVSVPGLTKEDIKISTKDSLLTISYKKEDETKTNIFVDNFQKSYQISDDVDTKNINGKVENGILELILPISKKKQLERFISLN